jgi:hypothetical protein
MYTISPAPDPNCGRTIQTDLGFTESYPGCTDVKKASIVEQSRD